MKKSFAFILLLLTLAANPAFAAEGDAVVADFNSAQMINNLGNVIEVWEKDNGADTTQSCKAGFVKDDALGNPEGQSLRLEYDVDSPNGAYNGARTELTGLDASGFTHLNFYLKGDAKTKFSPKLKIEMIGDTKVPSPYIVEGITGEWQKFTVPFSEFFAVRDWGNLDKFVIVFADITNKPKTGAIQIDQIYFSKE